MNQQSRIIQERCVNCGEYVAVPQAYSRQLSDYINLKYPICILCDKQFGLPFFESDGKYAKISYSREGKNEVSDI